MDKLAMMPPTKGFENIRRYVDKHQKKVIAKILPGELYVSKHSEYISTVLGSCISACIWDGVNKVGGMNHFLLPQAHSQRSNSIDLSNYTARYGNWAMEYLVNEVIKQGATRNNMQAKIFGGAKIIDAMKSNIGSDNVEFVIQFLTLENIPIAARDTGGPWPRKVIFHPHTGKVKVKKLHQLNNDSLLRHEHQYVYNIVQNKDKSDIELF